MYGNFSFGWLKDDSSDVEYKLGELGLIYSSKLDYINVFEAASIHLGYRFQALGYENSNYNNTINGLVFGVNLHF
ncbi:hypothetical protein [Candidatus Marithrix sp. Canyon 246]|uniref:hypothetical protein n=1 Tax=Candidatus Marithrix sp. Canyon 246 TaxID=1827136 RepID=UPI000849ECC9|nr:hypothetical protein [Candidatus Marithrix sp. Canyon 246]